MGQCCGSKPKPKPKPQHTESKPKTPQEWLFKTQSGTDKLIAFDSNQSNFLEEALSLPSNCDFQQNQLVCRVNGDTLLVVGGKDDGKVAMLIDLPSKTGRIVASPPIPIEHGALHLFGDACYAVGCVTQDNDSEVPAPLLSFHLVTHKWSFLPPMPNQVLYPGSFVTSTGINVLGGYIQSGNSLTHSKCIQTYYFYNQTWAVSNILTPLAGGFPLCVPLSDRAIVIIGGHDPSENFEESSEVFYFDWISFKPLSPLPQVGALCFKEPPLVTPRAIYAISEDEVLFTLSLETWTWAYDDIEAKLHESSVSERPKAPQRLPGDFVYHYDPESLMILEYNLVANSYRKTEPSTFQYFSKDPGIGLLANDCLIFAGGKLQGECIKKVWSFDPITRLTRAFPDLPHPQFGLRIVVIADFIYGIAGCDEHTLTVPDHKNFCQVLTAEGWYSIPPLPYTTKFPAVAALGTNIYSIGGKTQLEYEMAYNTIQKYNTQKQTWKLLKIEYPIGVYNLGIVSLPSGHLLCYGGLFSNGHSVSDSFLFDGKEFVGGAQIAHGLTQEPEDTKFLDCPVVRADSVYAFSAKGVLHKFCNEEWSIVLPSNRVST